MNLTESVMLDLETMGTEPNSAIVAIGAVHFNKDGATQNTFYRNVSLSSSMSFGLVADGGTIEWWLKQSDAVRNNLFNPAPIGLQSALSSFSDWFYSLENPKQLQVWGNGVDFDNTILGNAYNQLGLTTPWNFRNNRCYRTIKNLYPDIKQADFKGVQHSALDDAINQANHLVKIARDVT